MSTRMPEDQQTEELRVWFLNASFWQFQQVFDVFDQAPDGTVSLTEIKAILSEVYDESFEDLQELIGIKGDRINFETFKRLMTGDKF